KDALAEWQPDAVIPVDYPGFNLRIARYASRRGLPVFYYISPKVWAWKQRRIESLRKYTRRLFVIFPFEVAFFHKAGMETEYFGNPLLDEVGRFRKEFEGANAWKKGKGWEGMDLVALLAGSRKKEIAAMLPVMARVAREHPAYRFVVAGAPSISPEFYAPFLESGDLDIVYGETYALLESAQAGLVTSGTATLEAGLFGLPQVVLYRTSALAYSLAKRLIKINFISLVNLVLGRELVKEVIQKDMFDLANRELGRILDDGDYRRAMQEGYREMRSLLGDEGVSPQVAQRMVNLLRAQA
ncbi:MAG: lipid-A-disaccharide synthase, partial [Bacteroidales bacterium]